MFTLSSLITVVIVLVVVGVALYLIDTQLPIVEPIRTVIRVIVVLALVLWLLSFFGIWSGGLGR